VLDVGDGLKRKTEKRRHQHDVLHNRGDE
jgi:hypothetical protein